jgi:acetyltransferase-like isoleucine patch superfamily enzyme
MDPKIKNIIQLCRLEEDPCWPTMGRLFNNVTLDKYQVILNNNWHVITDILMDVEGKGGLRPLTQSALEKFVKPHNESIVTTESVMLAGNAHFPEYGVHIIANAPVYLGKGVCLSDVVIASSAWISKGARLEHTNIQSRGRPTFVGENAVLSNVGEVRGCFISGGPKRDSERPTTYVHASSINNTIVAAYAGLAVGVDVYNHPLPGERAAVIDYDTMKPHELPPEIRKLPVIIGLNATIGPQTLLHSGSIVGADVVVPAREEVDGMVFNGRGDRTSYVPAREKKQLYRTRQKS